MKEIIDFMADAIRPEWLPIDKPQEAICTITGDKTLCVSKKKALSSNFTTYSSFCAPDSDFIGLKAYQVLKYKAQRMSSWIVTEDGFRKLKRVEVRPLVLNGVETERWIGFVTTSYKKHGIFGNVVNNSRYGCWKFDELLIDCSDIDQVHDYYNRLNDYLHRGISRPVLETGNLNQFAVKKAGLPTCYEFLEWCYPRLKEPLYIFLCYLLPSQEEIKNENKSD